MPASSSDSSGRACLIACLLTGCIGLPLLILLMAALLFPIFARAREKARQASCLSNEKQQSLALFIYASDYDERFPLPATPTYEAALMPYAKNAAIFACPSDADGAPSYIHHPRLAGRTMSDMVKPDQLVLIHEGTVFRQPTSPHLGGSCFGYGDGHCKWLTESSYPGVRYRIDAAPPAG